MTSEMEFRAPKVAPGERAKIALRSVLRLILPVVSLLLVLVVSYFNMDRFVTGLDFFSAEQWSLNPGYWLTWGHLVLPLAFLMASLTNRRFGQSYAFAQVLMAWVGVGLITAAAYDRWDVLYVESPFPPMQISVAFMVAFVTAQLAQVAIFDKTRGRTWWGAPLFSTLWASLVYVVIFHTMAAWGNGQPWMDTMMVDFVIKAVLAVALLLPYFLLRRRIKSLPGYGGA